MAKKIPKQDRDTSSLTFIDEFDFKLLDSPNFKEDSVREEIVSPLLRALGYSAQKPYQIVRQKRLEHPYVRIGRTKRPVTIIPDYLLYVHDNAAWVIDAKGPNENIISRETRDQAYSYAIHPDVRASCYALCNGREIVLYSVKNENPIFHSSISELPSRWTELLKHISPKVFEAEKIVDTYESGALTQSNDEYYLNRKLLQEIPVRKQQTRRHFGVHGYFTKQAWNVVHEYIKNFSRRGDLVFDPFGGSGVTAIEALVLGRRAIHFDINPLSPFLAKALLVPVAIEDINAAAKKIISGYRSAKVMSLKSARDILKLTWHPRDIALPPTSDVHTIEKLFTTVQLAQLAVFKREIEKIRDGNLRTVLLLAFSGTVSKINRTYHPSTSRGDTGGDNSAFRYYRYRIAPEEVELDPVDTFLTKIKKIVAAKSEIQSLVDLTMLAESRIEKGDASDLSTIKTGSVDYIYTDPPYGEKIQYLDLSVMWNSWLGFDVSEHDYESETIEGGSRFLTNDHYKNSLARAIGEMFRVLKLNRWMSFVFAHKDPKYWHFILDTAESVGFEYVGTVKQSNGAQSFKKRQKPFSVLSGQLIINFRKVENPRTIQRISLGASIYDIVIDTIESVIARNSGATLEEINDELIVKGLELGFLDILSKEYKDLTPILMDNFDFDEKHQIFQIRPDIKFRSKLPIELRIRYFLISYLRRCDATRSTPTTDDVILHIMPLLKNGITPENQTILTELEKVADRVGENKWRLRGANSLELDL